MFSVIRIVSHVGNVQSWEANFKINVAEQTCKHVNIYVRWKICKVVHLSAAPQDDHVASFHRWL